MTLALFQVDTFTDQLFKGNPAAVVPLGTWLPDSTMQAIAEENNLSETAFFIPNGDGFHLRWFTPTIEVDFCGHATMATSHVLFQHLDYEKDQIEYQTRVGLVSVRQSENGYEMDAPADQLHEEIIPSSLEDALGAKIKELYSGREDLLAIVESEEVVRHVKPNFEAVAKLTNRGLLVSAPGEQVDFVSRCFFPNAGIDEDPVTGSAHTTMAPYWSERLGKSELTAHQISSRGGKVHCQLEQDRVILGGKAVTYLTGELFLPA